MFLDWYGTQMQLGYNTDTRGYEGHMLGDRWVGRSRVRDRLGYYSITPYKLLIDCNMHASHLILLASPDHLLRVAWTCMLSQSYIHVPAQPLLDHTLKFA